MKLKIFLFILLFLLSLGLFGKENNKIPEWYPSTRVYSNQDMIKFNSKYNRFINTYHLNFIKVGVDSISAHLKYVQIDNDFQLCDFTNTTDPVEEFKSKILDFYQDWWRLFSNERFIIDSLRISVNQDGSMSGRFYIKHNYGYKLYDPAEGFGSLTASVSNQGRLFFLSSSLVPNFRIPDHPIISKSDAIDILEGYEFTIKSWQYSHTIILKRKDLDKLELTLFVQKTTQNNDKCLKYRLVWKHECREANVYVDAMTGEIIGYVITVCFM